MICGDSTSVDLNPVCDDYGIEKFQFIIYHPPYWDIIKFSDNGRDLSNCRTLDLFLEKFGQVIDNTAVFLEERRYCTLVIGDKYANGCVIPLGFLCMEMFLQRGFNLKAIIVKNIGETKGKAQSHGLWRYRALANDFYVFGHEYIFVFKK